tara:strand:+ start:2081 stop:2869 length:789 start_codon:yes stop_codon:yes gene_type:complete
MFSIVKVKKVPRLNIKLKIKFSKSLPINSDNETEIKDNTSPNISLSIHQQNNEDVENISQLDHLQVNKDTINTLSTITEETTYGDETVYDNHYVSFIILFPLYFRKPNINNISSILGVNMLLKRDHIVQTYKIDHKPDFKYKTFIRGKVLDDYSYKNKDISIIKSINTYRNYHNYIVVVKHTSIRNKLFNDQISSLEDTYKWRQLYDFYNPIKMTPDLKEPTIRDAYTYLSNKSVLKKEFTDIKTENNIDIKDVFKSISLII